MNMKQLLVFLYAMVSLSISAQNNPDDILGKWVNEDATVRIEIFKTNHTYNSKIIWLASPNNGNGELKLDKNNPDNTLRNKPILGLVIINGLEFSTNNSMWINGKIYIPEKGKTANCNIKLSNKNEFSISVSKSIFSTTKKWQRYDE